MLKEKQNTEKNDKYNQKCIYRIKNMFGTLLGIILTPLDMNNLHCRVKGGEGGFIHI